MNTPKDDEIDGETALALLHARTKNIFIQPRTSAFKYVSLTDKAWPLLERTLLENKLTLTSANTLNDPFDVSPILIDDLSHDDRVEFASKLRAWDNGPQLDVNTIRVEREDGTVLSATELAKITTDTAALANKEFNAEHHLSALSRRINSQLLWGHYTDKYYGLAYHFIISGAPESDLSKMRAVTYSTQRPILSLSEITQRLFKTHRSITDLRSWYSYQERAFLTKSIEWSYEEEIRIIKRAKEATFLDHELAGIVIGPRINDHDLEKIRTIVRKRKRPLNLYRARLSKTDYSIEVDWSQSL